MKSKDVGHDIPPELIPLKRPEETNNRASQIRTGRSLLIRYMKGGDWALLSIGTFFALVHGTAFPLVTLILGHMTDILLSQAEQRCNQSISSHHFFTVLKTDSYEDIPIEDLLQNTSSESFNPQQLINILSSEPGSLSQENFEDLLSYLSAMIGFVVLVAAFFQPLCLELCSSRQLYHLQQNLFHNFLRQKIAWYDSHKEKDIVGFLHRHLEQIHHGTSNKLGMFLQYFATSSSGFIIAFIVNWRLTLFIFPFLLLTLVVPRLLDKVYLDLTTQGYTEAGQIAEEILLNYQPDDHTDGDEHDMEMNCYKKALQEGQKATLRKYRHISSGVLAGYLMVNAALAIALWQNWKLVDMGCLAPGTVTTVFFSVIGGMVSVNKTLTYATAVISAMQSAKVLGDIIDNIPVGKEYVVPEAKETEGKVQFIDVSFNNPTESNKQMLHNLSFEVTACQSAAFLDLDERAGNIVMDLLLGFYKPTTGKVLLHGNMGCSRSVFSVINTEPKLFTCLSVLDNIALGLNDVQFNQVAQAATKVGVHGYIPGLPLGYDTLVEIECPTILKQRIELARVPLHDPKILIIDDTTSHCNTNTKDIEKLINTLHTIKKRCITIILSQRLPIIQHVNIIYVLKNGTLCESGSHTELMDRCQEYCNWVTLQNQNDSNDITMKTIQPTDTDVKRSKSSVFAPESELVKQDPPHRHSVLYLGSPDWHWLTFCLLSHISSGLGLPALARLFGDIFVPKEEHPNTSHLWGYMVLCVAVIVGFSTWLQLISTATWNARLLSRLYIKTFSALLCQAEKEEEIGKKKLLQMHAQFTHDLPSVRMVTASRMCEIVGASISLVAAMVAAFLHGWKMELVLLLVFPAIAIAFHLKTKIVQHQQEQQYELMQPSNVVMTECALHIRMLRLMGGEDLFENLYSKKLNAPYKGMKKHAFVYALVYALVESGLHVLYAASFKYGFFLIRSQLMKLVKVYRIFFALGICIISMNHLLAYRQEWIATQNTLNKLFQHERRNEQKECDS